MPTRNLDPISTPTLNRQLTMTNALDIATINTLELVSKDFIHSKVCYLELMAYDAEERGMAEYARQLKHAARELDLLSYGLCSIFTVLFIDQLDQQIQSVTPKTSGHGAVSLPNLSEPETIDATALAI